MILYIGLVRGGSGTAMPEGIYASEADVHEALDHKYHIVSALPIVLGEDAYWKIEDKFTREAIDRLSAGVKRQKNA